MLAGDREAFRLLVREHSLGLRSFLGSQLHHADEMDDLAQEVFLKAFRNLSEYEIGRDFRAWLRGIARNQLLMYFRSVGRRQSHEARFREEVTNLIHHDLDQAFDQRSEFAIEALLRCIGQLPERMRRVVRAGLDGTKSKSLAAELSTSIGAVYNLHYRANGMLRECVSKEMEVIDVGTAFSIDVQNGKQSEVHVLEGSVEIKLPERDMLELNEFHAIRMGESGPIDVAYSPERFPDPEKLRNQQTLRADQRYESWQQYAAEINSDPDVLLHYTFEETDPNSLELKNRCVDSSTATDGVVIGCDWTEGRWPSKRALLYRNANDRVLFQVPGEFSAVTFLAWVRIDALTQMNTSLMMTESAVRRRRFTPAAGSEMRAAIARRESSSVETVRWELNQKRSSVLLSVGHATDIAGEWEYDKASAMNESARPIHWGQWACLAVTCDVVSGEVVHYRNGDVIGTGQWNHNAPLLLDFMELGNFGVSVDELKRSDGLSQRRFYGAIDEVVVARRIFEPTEIKVFWLNGKP